MLHYNDVPPTEVDQQVLSFLPLRKDDGHMFFDGIVARFRELRDWDVLLGTGESLVWESLKRLQKSHRVVMDSHPQSPLFFSRLN